MSEGDANRLRNDVDALQPDDRFDPTLKRVNQSSRNSYHCTFLDTNVEYKRRVAELLEHTFDSLISDTFRDYRVLASNFYLKQPGKGRFQVHQNWSVLGDLRHTSFTIWCPLQDTDARNGTLHIVERSHRILPYLASLNVPEYFAPFEERLFEKYLRPLTVKAGECIIFDDSMIHWSSNNDTDDVRYAVQICVIPAESVPIHAWHDPANPSAGLELFHLDRDFYTDKSSGDVIRRPLEYPLLGTIPSPNFLLQEDEFVAVMESGDEIRQSFMDGSRRLPSLSQSEKKKSGNILARIRNIFHS